VEGSALDHANPLAAHTTLPGAMRIQGPRPKTYVASTCQTNNSNH
jgi:hypothetical protein